MNTGEMLQMIKEVISEVKTEMGDYTPEIEIAAQFAAIRMFKRLNTIYDFKELDKKV